VEESRCPMLQLELASRNKSLNPYRQTWQVSDLLILDMKLMRNSLYHIGLSYINQSSESLGEYRLRRRRIVREMGF